MHPNAGRFAVGTEIATQSQAAVLIIESPQELELLTQYRKLDAAGKIAFLAVGSDMLKSNRSAQQ